MCPSINDSHRICHVQDQSEIKGFFYSSIHLAALLRVRVSGAAAQAVRPREGQGSLGLTALPGLFVQLFRRDAEAFPGQPGDSLSSVSGVVFFFFSKCTYFIKTFHDNIQH